MFRALLAVLLTIASFALHSENIHAQTPPEPGTIIKVQNTPHLWIADDQGVLHWGGDTRALADKHIAWDKLREIPLNQLLTYNIGDPWLSAGLLKDGDPIYLVKWEADWDAPKLLHILSIGDVSLFGINGGNYGDFVLDVATWEARYGLTVAGLERGTLEAIESQSVAPAPAPPPTPTEPAAQATPPPADTAYSVTGKWEYGTWTDELTQQEHHVMNLLADQSIGDYDYGIGMALILRCAAGGSWDIYVVARPDLFPGDSLDQLEVHYRFGTGAIIEEWWDTSENYSSAFIPENVGKVNAFARRLVQADESGNTRLVIRIWDGLGERHTAVFDVAGAKSTLFYVFDRCPD